MRRRTSTYAWTISRTLRANQRHSRNSRNGRNGDCISLEGENQAFLDGNKRTALVATLVFLDINGFVILDDEMKLYDAMIAIANREMDKYDLADLLKELSQN